MLGAVNGRLAGCRSRSSTLGDLHDIIRDAGPSVKATIYEQLGLKVTCL